MLAAWQSQFRGILDVGRVRRVLYRIERVTPTSFRCALG